MPDHVHKWEPLFDREHPQPWDAAEWRCECARILTHDQIERRLNATERLSAEDAEGFVRYLDVTVMMDYPALSILKEKLEAYVAALEKD